MDGDRDASAHDLSTIENGQPNTLTFLANPSYTPHIYTTQASVAIVSKDFAPEKALPKTLTLVKVDDPRLAFSKLMEAYAQMLRKPAGIHATAVVEDGAQIDSTASIGAFVVVESGAKIGAETQVGAHCFIGADSTVGARCTLHESVHVGARCMVGNDCMLQPGAILGADGFGFAPDAENEYQKVVHLGNVILEDHVEIGASTTIDRGTLGSTIIRKGVKLDNLIQVAHNVEIGENTVIAAQTGIAGSAKIGKNCMIGGQVGIVGHITIADEVKIAAQSGIGGSIKTKGQIVQGSPALPIGDFKRSYVHFRKLHVLADDVDALKAASAPTNDNNHG